jgi:hypothetical protein
LTFLASLAIWFFDTWAAAPTAAAGLINASICCYLL